MEFTHLNQKGRGHMVDISEKPASTRVAKATATVNLSAQTLEKVKEGALKKGDVLAIAQIAGISAAKSTWEQIPLCHQIPLTGADIDFDFLEAPPRVRITATVKTNYATGVEMEALLAATTAALTIYDMCKAVQKDICITDIFLLEKTGGKEDYFQGELSCIK